MTEDCLDTIATRRISQKRVCTNRAMLFVLRIRFLFFLEEKSLEIEKVFCVCMRVYV